MSSAQKEEKSCFLMIGQASGARLISQPKRVAIQTKCLRADHLTFEWGVQSHCRPGISLQD